MKDLKKLYLWVIICPVMLGMPHITTYAATPGGVEYKNDMPVLPAPAQEKQIHGIVTDEYGEPLMGANVVVKGTTKATITDMDGHYSLTVNTGDVIIISYLGHIPAEFTVGARNDYSITLEENLQEIDEVVVIGYGTVKKQNLTGSVSSVNFNEAMESRPTTNLSSALAGMSPGLVISQAHSSPGAEKVNINVRGVGTMNDASPLVLIDGVIGEISDVNPNDVESVSVLKDASSSAIYGSRAANGVILITTKRGGNQKVKVNYNGYVGWQSTANMIDFISDYPTHMELLNEAAINSGQSAYYDTDFINNWRSKSQTDPLNYPNTDWFRDILNTAVMTEHNVSVSGGSDKTRFMLSLGYLDNKGVMDNSGYKRYSFRLNVDSQVSKWLDVGANVYGQWSDKGVVDLESGGIFSHMLNTNPGILPKSSDGRYGGTMNPQDIQGAYNPRAYIDNVTGNNERQYAGVKFFARINFLKYFQWENSFAGNYDNRRNWQYYSPTSLWNFRDDYEVYTMGAARNSVMNESSRYYSTTLNSLLRFNYTINRDHEISAIAGFDQEYSRKDQFRARKYDLLGDVIHVLDAAAADAEATGKAEDRALRSWFGRVNYSYKGKYLFEANARYDGSSRFAADNRWGFFPSFSAGWRLSEEEFFENAKEVINNLKFRGSWGKLGNNRIGDYEYQSLYAAQNYSFGGNIVQGVAMTSLSNRKVSWEATEITNIGLDMGFLNNSLTFSMDWFTKTTHDILVKLPIPSVMGMMTAPHQNVAEVRNRGFEFQANYHGNIGKDFTYSIGANVSRVDNKVLKYDGEAKTIDGAKVLVEGSSIWQYYVREVDHIVQNQSEIDRMIEQGYTFSPNVPQVGDFLYKDTNGDKIINDDDRVIKGSSIPKVTYGLTLNAAYKGFDLFVLGQGVGGIDAYYGGQEFNTYNLNQGFLIRESVLNRWTPENPSTTHPRLTVGLANNTVNSDYWLQSAAYFKIKSLQLGYTIPRHLTSKVFIDRLRVYGSLENFFTFTNYDGFDPENVGVVYPSMKQCVIGVNVSF